jgi:hypothetical protein
MSTETNPTNPFATILQFYSSQAEKISPVLQQGIDDWFTVYNKIWTGGMKLQSDLIKQVTGTEQNNELSEQLKNIGVKVIAMQKEFSSNLVNAGMKGVKSIIEAAKKNKREGK